MKQKKNTAAAGTVAKTKKSGSGNGFQKLGLSHPVLKAIGHKGYKLPTPIQRKCIPVIMEGADVVGMARTGSGKTAAFIIPMLEKLKVHSAKMGARAIVLSPSRELALQTLKFTKDLCKYTDLRIGILVGGDSMEEQFSMIANSPDILIATPGRLMHVMMEMNLSLKTVEYLVFDEADRLFELGFATQLREILHKISPSRQTILFSATLPKNMLEFAKAGLTDPVLVRLDVETKISQELEMSFLATKNDYKEAMLMFLLNKVIPAEESSIVFVATKHHVEYIMTLLTEASHDADRFACVYGAMDQTARTANVDRFRRGQAKVLIVTDVASRGIDIPLLDNVINYHFPAQPKLFVHRVGRAARAGRRGKAYSMVSPDEMPFLVDLQLFLSRPMVLCDAQRSQEEWENVDLRQHVVYGDVPQSALDAFAERRNKCLHESVTLTNLHEVTEKAKRMYMKTRPVASPASYTRAKEIHGIALKCHPAIHPFISQDDVAKNDFLAALKNFKPSETIFEIVGHKGKSTGVGNVGAIKQRRMALDAKILERRQNRPMVTHAVPVPVVTGHDEAVDEAMKTVFKEPSTSNKKRAIAHETSSPGLKKAKKESFKDESYYMSYTQKDADTEKGFSINQKNSFSEQAAAAVLDMANMGDDAESLKRHQSALKWDKKKKKFIRQTIGSDNKKRIRTESGAIIPASYKTDAYQNWLKKTKIVMPHVGESELSQSAAPAMPTHLLKTHGRRKRFNTTLSSASRDDESGATKAKETHGKRSAVARKKKSGPVKSELRDKNQIYKQRLRKEKKQIYQQKATARRSQGKRGKQ